MYRWFLIELDGAGRELAFATQARVLAKVSVCSQKIEPGIYDTLKVVVDYLFGLKEQAIKSETKANIWQRRVNRIRFIPMSAFFLGILTLAVVAVINWPETPASSAPKPIPQIRQG